MTHPQTIADLERILGEIDSELAKLRALVRRGEELREMLARELAAVAPGNDP
jgi:hypothetical protein